ncbi:MAG: hypothetical protein C5B54_07350 [Acidobacteria bacterium]|nr:MAG: hypothetical protein C5B54_07350 [Acidobacteriota bacterium]
MKAHLELGFSLMEFLLASFLFGMIVICCYRAITAQNDFSRNIISRTKPEAESNYRLLILQGLLSNSSNRFKRDPLAEAAPHFFPDLEFGKHPRPDAFTVAVSKADPVRFLREGSLFRTPVNSAWKENVLLLVAGSGIDGSFIWNYARIESVQSGNQLLQLNFLLPEVSIESGILQEIDLIGLQYQKETLYVVTSSGALEPFFGPLEDFHYEWNQSKATLHWKSGSIQSDFVVTP